MFSTHASSHPAPQNDFMDIDDDMIDVDSPVPAHPLLSAAQNLNPFSLINSTLGQRFFDGGTSEFLNRTPQVTHPREVREVPIEFKNGDNRAGSSTNEPTIEEVTESIPESIPERGPEFRGNVIVVDDDEDLQSVHSDREGDEFGDGSLRRSTVPNFTPLIDIPDLRNDIEEEMIQAAIEASKREAEAATSQQFDVPNVVSLN